MISKNIIIKNKHLPDTPGVYLMKGKRGKLLYIGKAGNLCRRVESYFAKAHDSRIQNLVARIHYIDYEKTDTAVEALILESKLIKKYSPPFNVREKDDKSFLYVAITREKFPRVLVIRGKDQDRAHYRKTFGPFPSSSQLREALKIIRRIFPWNTHPGSNPRMHSNDSNRKLESIRGIRVNSDFSDRTRQSRSCFEAQIGLCPGICVGAISTREYAKTIRNVILFFEGKKERIIRNLEREMRAASKRTDFEKAATIRGKLFALKHIQDVALISHNETFLPLSSAPFPFRIEGYDISNIGGESAVASMVVFVNGRPAKQEYRKFRMRSVGPNDVAMIKETVLRRFNHQEWPLPNFIVVDGGVGQIRAAREAIRAHGLRVPVIGIAKGPQRKRNDIIGLLPKGVSRETIIKVRDEAHRFAISYHKNLRGREFLAQNIHSH